MRLVVGFLFLLMTTGGFAQYPTVFSDNLKARITEDSLSHFYLSAERIVWQSGNEQVKGAELLLNTGTVQPSFAKQPICQLQNIGDSLCSILLDFGTEIHGGIQITTMQSNNANPRVRLRFGESVSEACSELAPPNSGYGGGLGTNHHAMRDFELTLPGYGTIEVGNTGFRFIRLDLLGRNAKLVLAQIRAAVVMRKLPYLGSFKSDNSRLNKIWQTGAYTVQLCMQDYLLDGIKRDRMVWAGDIGPEIATISAAFGYNDIVPKSLDFLRDQNPKFINGIASYSMWWVLMQYDWYLYHGRLDYLKAQKTYLLDLLDRFTQYVDSTGVEQLNNIGMRFIDWPTYGNKDAVHAGLQALLAMTFDRGAKLCKVLGEAKQAERYHELALRTGAVKMPTTSTKQAAALLSLAGMVNAEGTNKDVIAKGGPKGFSAFMGYYMLLAQAKAGDYKGALHNIEAYWGGMLDLGATTFWEEFDLEEAKNAGRIDDFVPEGKLDYHRSTGKDCYIGLRRSLCHGWASGPTAWLTQYVLGVQVLSPGCRKVLIEPHLGDLNWVEGSFPTPYGLIHIQHRKQADGSVASTVQGPKEVEIILSKNK